MILTRLSDQQDQFAAAQLSMQAEQARQQEAQTLVLEGIRQQQEAMRLQLQQQSQIQQQMFTFFSGCFGQLYRHTGLPEPQLPTPQQLQFDPTAPAPPVGGFVQTPLASFPMSPLLQTGLFASPAHTSTAAPALAPQPSIWTAEQRAEFLRQQQVLHQLQHPSAKPLTFDSPSQPEVLRPSVVRPTQPDLTPVTSAPPTDSTVVAEPASTATPATSAALTTPVEQKSSSVDDDWMDDDADDSAAQFSTGPSLKTPPSPAQD